MTLLAQTLEQLGRAHGFTLEHLEANRRGEVHPHQRARVRRQAITGPLAAFLVGDLLLVAGLVGAFLFHQDLREPVSASDRNAVVAIAGAGVLVSGLFFVGAALSLRRHARRRAAFDGRVEAVEGPALKAGLEGRGGASSRWWFSISGRRFDVHRATWELVTHGARYRAFVIGGDLLSLEPLPR